MFQTGKKFKMTPDCTMPNITCAGISRRKMTMTVAILVIFCNISTQWKSSTDTFLDSAWVVFPFDVQYVCVLYLFFYRWRTLVWGATESNVVASPAILLQIFFSLSNEDGSARIIFIGSETTFWLWRCDNWRWHYRLCRWQPPFAPSVNTSSMITVFYCLHYCCSALHDQMLTKGTSLFPSLSKCFYSHHLPGNWCNVDTLSNPAAHALSSSSLFPASI